MVQFFKKICASGWCALMNSFKNERCHGVTRLPSKLETGCRQLLHKLKSCKDTETKEIRGLQTPGVCRKPFDLTIKEPSLALSEKGTQTRRPPL